MARNRMIKPEFWTSEQILNCSPMARLLFIGLWCYADDNGIHPSSVKTLKAEVFPADDISIEAIKGFISELIEQGLLKEYAVGDKSFWIITGWKTHQKIERPRSRYPLPQEESKIHYDEDKIGDSQKTFDDDSTTSRRFVVERSSNHRRLVGSENKIKENNIINICGVETPPDGVSAYSSDSCKQVFEYWQRVMNHPRAKLDPKRKRVIELALNPFSIEDLKLAIHGCRNTPFNMGENERKQKYDDIGLILRDAAHIERFMNNAESNKGANPCHSRDSMAGVM